MRTKGVMGGLALAAMLAGQGAHAGPCDYRPSKVAGAAANEVGQQVRAVGSFALTNAVTGGSLLGSSTTAAGTTAGSSASASSAASNAGTLHSVIGAALGGTSTVIVAAAAAVGAAGYEGLCYFADRKVTKYNELLGVMRGLAANADPESFRLDEGKAGKQDATITVKGEDGQPKTYPVSKLYIDNNKLKFRKLMGKDEDIGQVDFVPKETEALPAGSTEKTTAPAAPAPTPPAAPAAAAPAGATTGTPSPEVKATATEAAAPPVEAASADSATKAETAAPATTVQSAPAQ